MQYNIKETLAKHSGRAFMHLEDAFWMQVIRETLEYTNGNTLKSSEILGVSRATFIMRYKQLGINPRDYKPVAPHKTKHHKKFDSEIITKLLAENGSIRKAAAKVKVHPRTLTRHMERLGLK